MRKICFVLIIILLFTVISCGASMAIEKELELTFSGTTATCSTLIKQYGSNIHVTMELYRGSTFITSWSKSGTNRVSINETRLCTSGQTYTLQVNVTVDGSPVYVPPVTKTCP